MVTEAIHITPHNKHLPWQGVDLTAVTATVPNTCACSHADNPEWSCLHTALDLDDVAAHTNKLEPNTCKRDSILDAVMVGQQIKKNN